MYHLSTSPARRRAANRQQRATREAVARLRDERGLLIEIGSGGRGAPGWVQFDLKSRYGIPMDATKTWPLQDGCARAVRSEHMIEHVSLAGGRAMVDEALRVLEPGGVIRICTPDLEAIARAYLDRDPHVLEVHRSHGYDAPTWAHFLDNYLRAWGHAFIYDLDALRTVLFDAGFVDVERVGYGESRHHVLRGTDTHDLGDLHSLAMCIDAVKPRE